MFSLSVNPERIVISISRESSSYPLLREHGLFGLNVLSADQQHVADRFAGRGGVKGEERYQGAQWTVSPRGVSLLVNALATAECAVEEIIERHSHAIVIGEPLSIEAESDADPLIYWRRVYRSAGYSAAYGCGWPQNSLCTNLQGVNLMSYRQGRDPVKFAYWVLNVSGGLVISDIEQRTNWSFEYNTNSPRSPSGPGSTML